jgi:hypothetical protein
MSASEELIRMDAELRAQHVKSPLKSITIGPAEYACLWLA